MEKFISIFLLLCSVLSATEIKLKEKLGSASEGSYLVLEQNKTYTFLHIHTLLNNSLTIEEVSIPAASFPKDLSWKGWFEKGAPGHTSWVMSEINIETGNIEEAFSFTHQGWIDLSKSDPFFTTLLNLSFQEIPLKERRRTGLSKDFDRKDKRPLWNPRLLVDGKVVPNISFTAFKARWPADGTELARTNIEIYLPNPPSESECYFPICFPYWLEIDSKCGSAKLRVVDSGINAHSPKQKVYKKGSQLSGKVELNSAGLFVELDTPSYLNNFILLAEEDQGFFGPTSPLPCKVISESKGKVSLIVSHEHLNTLSCNINSYTLLVIPKEEPGLLLRLSLKELQSML